VFENKLAAVLSGTPPEARKDGKLAAMARPLLEAVAAPSATPGGGSASAFAAALAAALGQMVAGLSRKKKSQAEHVEVLSEHLDHLRNEAEVLAEAIDRDAASYDAVLAAFKLPHGDAHEAMARDEAIESATKGAADVPMFVAERSVALLESLRQLDSIAAASMKSDLKVARLIAAAGAQGALANVEVNLGGLKDSAYVAATKKKLDALRGKLEHSARAHQSAD
jgi:formiminotetrahydrofolate cyclodeaminase